MAKPANGTPLNAAGALYSGIINAYGFFEGSGTTAVDSKAGNDAVVSSGLWATSGGDPILTIASPTAAPVVPATPISFDGTQSFSIAFGGNQSAADNNGMFLGDNTTTNTALWLHNGLFAFRNFGANNDFT